MAVLPDADRRECWAEYIEWQKNRPDRAQLNKPQIRAMIDSIDDYRSSTAATFNAAIPQPARAAMNPEEKAKALEIIVRKALGR